MSGVCVLGWTLALFFAFLWLTERSVSKMLEDQCDYWLEDSRRWFERYTEQGAEALSHFTDSTPEES